MDPILEEMRRAKSPGDVKASRFRDWVQYLCALVAAKDDEISHLKARFVDLENDIGEAVLSEIEKRKPGRPRKCRHCGQPETRHEDTCSYSAFNEAVTRG